MPTAQFLTGFEHGLHSISGGGLFAALTGTAPTMDTAVVKDGVYSMKVPIPASAFESDTGMYTTAAGTRRVVRFHFRCSGSPSTSISICENKVEGTIYFSVGLQTDRTLQLYPTGGTSPVSGGFSPVLAVDTWHLIEIVMDVNSASFRGRLRVNGTEVSGDVTMTGAAAGVFSTAKMGVTNSVTLSTARDLWFDNVIFGSSTVALTNGVEYTDYWGDGKTIKILPASDGTHSFTDNDFSTGDAGTQRAVGYTDFNLMVDDAVPWTTTRSTTDNIAQRVIRTAGYVEINPADTPESGTANAVRALLAYSSTSTTADSGKCEIRNSAGAAVEVWGIFPSTTQDYSETTNFFKGAIATKPAGLWTPSELNALHWRLGGSGDIIPVPTWQALMLEVDYSLAVAANLPPKILIVNFAPTRAATY